MSMLDGNVRMLRLSVKTAQFNLNVTSGPTSLNYVRCHGCPNGL